MSKNPSADQPDNTNTQSSKGSHLSNKGKDVQPDKGLLAELAEKTAKLTKNVTGDEGPQNRTLHIESEDLNDTIDSVRSDTPESREEEQQQSSAAADLIRDKLSDIYTTEPDAAKEAEEVVAMKHKRSKHQQFMYNLTTSGKPLAQIQTDWHEYYVQLSDDEKHEVWQEFYQNQNLTSAHAQYHVPQTATNEPEQEVAHINTSQPAEAPQQAKKVSDIKKNIHAKVSANGRLGIKDHFKSLAFGIGLAGFVGLVIGFVFFNEVFVAPFISPSQSVSATPIIGQVEENIGPEPKIIIPKINLEVPVVYDLGTVQEDAIQDALEDGVVHYAASPEPGELGNSVIVGHSSNNIFNSGRYKFAFVLLRRLEAGDTFFVHKDGVRYTYKVFEKKIVPPTDVSVLGKSSRDNTMTLITCDPPGTSINRLIIVAEQISPDPSGNVESTPDVELPSEEAELPSNAPSLWSRFTDLF